MESGELSREGVVRDAATGELFIPATRRADGTWRKPRRVKEGYLPPEEVPAFETKGNLWQKNQPTGPVGLHIDEKQQSESAMSKAAKKNAKRKEKKKQQKTDDSDTGAMLSPPDRQSKPAPPRDTDQVKSAGTTCDPLKEADRDATKRLRSLRKKLKQIDDIKRRIDSGELKSPEKDQLEKISRRQVVADELDELMRNLNVDD